MMVRLNKYSLSLLGILALSVATATAQGPSTSVLDDFTHTDNPLSDNANWGGAFDASTTDLRASSGNFVDTDGTPACSTSIYTASTFGPDMEAYATHGADAGSENKLFVRIQSPGSSAVDGYMAEMSCGSDVIKVHRIDNGAETQLGSNISQVCAANDKWLLRIEGDTLTVDYDSGGGWTELATRTDSTYTGTGSIGIGACTSSQETDFGGGTVSAASSRRRMGQRFN